MGLGRWASITCTFFGVLYLDGSSIPKPSSIFSGFYTAIPDSLLRRLAVIESLLLRDGEVLHY